MAFSYVGHQVAQFVMRLIYPFEEGDYIMYRPAAMAHMHGVDSREHMQESARLFNIVQCCRSDSLHKVVELASSEQCFRRGSLFEALSEPPRRG